MKIKTALKTISALFLLAISSIVLYAQTYVPVNQYDVNLNASIRTDLYTQLSLTPITVEIMQPSTVNIIALDWNNTPRPNRNIVLYVSGVSDGITINQPSPTNTLGRTSGSVFSSIPGTYTICAKDITEGYDILILDCETLYVVPVPPPVMVAEPAYTVGTTNLVLWNKTGAGSYQYYTESSRNVLFSPVYSNSGWISNLAHEFSNLQNGLMYFYRVKARNLFGGESSWSNTVFSVQDSSGPEVELLSISDAGENSTTQWDKEFSINIRYRIKDNIGLQSKDFWCVGTDGSRYECQYTVVENGDLWIISLKLKALLTDNKGNLLQEYKFCVEASDLVGNVTRNCEAKLEITKEEEEEVPSTPVIPQPPKTPVVIDRVIKVVEKVIENTVGRLDPVDLQNFTYTTTAANLTVGVGLLITTIGYLPYFLLQMILALLSLLGFRKKGNITGYVYNSVSKEPIPQAIVRMFNENHELVWTDVTDSNGYFRSTDFEDGEYYIKVTARNHIFPSKVVFGRTDFPLENVYHGDPFFTRGGKVPNFSIPMDQEELSIFEKIVARFISRTKSIWKSIHILLFLIGLLFSIYALHISQIWWNYLIVLIYIPALIALIISLFSKKEKYGIVRDEKKKEIEGVIVGLTEKEFDKLVSKRVTDSLGRYRFIVNKGMYNISIMNSNIKVVNGDKLTDLEVKKEGGSILCPNIVARKLEDSSGTEEIAEPLKEL
jgi:hypothetical protein